MSFLLRCHKSIIAFFFIFSMHNKKKVPEINQHLPKCTKPDIKLTLCIINCIYEPGRISVACTILLPTLFPHFPMKALTLIKKIQICAQSQDYTPKPANSWTGRHQSFPLSRHGNAHLETLGTCLFGTATHHLAGCTGSTHNRLYLLYRIQHHGARL